MVYNPTSLEIMHHNHAAGTSAIWRNYTGWRTLLFIKKLRLNTIQLTPKKYELNII